MPQITDSPRPIFVELNNNQDAKAAVIVYGMPGAALRYAKGMKNWLSNVRGIDPERLIAMYGGPSDIMRLELWLVPRGSSLPVADASAAYQDLTLFETYRYWSGEYNYCRNGRARALAAFAAELKKRPNWRGALIIRPHRNRRGMDFGDADWDPDGQLSRREAARRIAKDRIYLIKRFGIAPSRIKAEVGSAGEGTHTELWMIPPDSKAKNTNHGK